LVAAKAFFFCLLILLAACTQLSQQPQQPDPRVDELLAGMAQCLDNQAQLAEQLAGQERQLEVQQQQLDAVSAGLDSIGLLREPPPVAAAIECPAPQPAAAKLVVGQLEQVWLPDLELALPARIDTGAETASLDAHDIRIFERDGRNWVRFKLQHPQTAEPLLLERRLVRTAAIIQSNVEEAERRPVIRLAIRIGHIDQVAEFTLSDRSHLDYQVLVGRNILRDVMVVDVSGKNLAPPTPPRDDPEDAGR
jgi:hypothetical protein